MVWGTTLFLVGVASGEQQQVRAVGNRCIFKTLKMDISSKFCTFDCKFTVCGAVELVFGNFFYIQNFAKFLQKIQNAKKLQKQNSRSSETLHSAPNLHFFDNHFHFDD